MMSAMPAVMVRRGRKRGKTFGRFKLPSSHHSSTSSLNRNRSVAKRGQSISTISGGAASMAFRRRRHPDLDLDRQRRRFIVYLGTLFLITGLLLVFVGVGASIPTAQTLGLLLIGIGAVLCIIKVFCSEAHATEVPQKVPVDVDVESAGENLSTAAADEATPLADISEFTEVPTIDPHPAQDGTTPGSNGHQNSLTPTSPPNSIPETQVLIGNDSEKY